MRLGMLFSVSIVLSVSACVSAQGRPDVVWMRGGFSGNAAIAYTADGALLASANEGDRVMLWRTSDWTLVRAFAHPPNGVQSMALSPDGAVIASGGKRPDCTIMLRRVADGALLATLTGHTAGVDALAFSPDGSLVASGADFGDSVDSSVKIWRASDGELLQTLPTGPQGAKSVAFAPDGATIATASGGESLIRLWRVADGAPAGTLTGHTGGLHSVAFRQDGTLLSASGTTIKLWRVPDGTLIRTITMRTTASVAAWSPDGAMIATGGGGNTTGQVALWDPADGRLLRTMTGHDENAATVVFSPDGATIASGDRNGVIGIWRTLEMPPIQTLGGGHGPVAFSPSEGLLATAGPASEIRLWRVADGAHVRSIASQATPASTIRFAFSPDGSLIAKPQDDWVHLWRVSDGARLRSYLPHVYPYCVAFSPDGTRLAVGGDDEDYSEPNRVLSVVRVADGAVLMQLGGHTTQVNAVAYSPDGATMASGGFDHTVRLWRASNGALLHTLTGHTRSVRSVAFSPDGLVVASTSEDGTIRLWRVADGLPLNTLLGHTGYVYSAAFAPNGLTLASAGGWADPPGGLALWLASDGTPVRVYDLETGWASSVAYSPSGTYLAYISGSGTVTVARNPFGAPPAPVSTSLAVATVTGRIADTVTLHATLTSCGAGVPGREVAFAVGSEAGTATTDANGVARLTRQLPESVGVGLASYAASFAGDAVFAASSGTGSLWVTSADTTMVVLDRSGIIGTTATLRAYLYREADSGCVVGRSVEFQVDGASVGSATTDSNGRASLAWTIDCSVGAHTLTGRFAGDGIYNPTSKDAVLTAFEVPSTKVYVPARTGRIRCAALLRAYLFDAADTPVPGQSLTVMLDGSIVGTRTTDAGGRVEVTTVVPDGAGAGSREIGAAFAGSPGYGASSGTGVLTVTPGDLHLWLYVRSAKVGTTHPLKVYVRSLPDYAIQPGKLMTFRVDGTEVGSAAVAGNGWAVAGWPIPPDEPTGPHTATAGFAGDAWFLPQTRSATFNVVP